jgi:hypothetical protein
MELKNNEETFRCKRKTNSLLSCFQNSQVKSVTPSKTYCTIKSLALHSTNPLTSRYIYYTEKATT